MARRPDPAKSEKILNSAIEVFLKKGYRDSTVAEITANAGLTASNAYIYYKNKEELLIHVVRRMMKEHTAEFTNLSEQCVGLGIEEFVDRVFASLEVIKPRILFIMHCVITPALVPLFKEFDFDYSRVFTPYVQNLKVEHPADIIRTLMALSDSYFLVGDIDNVKNSAIQLLKNAHSAAGS